MPIASTCAYIQGLLDGLVMPGNCPDMAAELIPSDPNVQTDTPTAYVWPSVGREARDTGNAGTMPRNTGPGTAAACKTIVHSVDIYIVWMGANDDPLFLGIVDAVMKALRTAYPMPAIATDPYTDEQTQIVNVGEVQDYRTAVSALADQAWNRYDALVTLPVTEVLQA